MGLEVDEPFGFDAGFDVSNACFKTEDILDVVHDLDKTPLEGSRDVFMHKDLPSLGYNNAHPNPLDYSHVCPKCPPLSISPKYSLDEPTDDPKMCD